MQLGSGGSSWWGEDWAPPHSQAGLWLTVLPVTPTQPAAQAP